VVLADGLRHVVFVGFESAAALAEETRDPRRNVPRAVADHRVAGAFYLLLTYATRSGTAPRATDQWPRAAAAWPYSREVTRRGWATGCWLAGACARALRPGRAQHGEPDPVCHGSRGGPAAALGRTHPRNATPHIAIAVTSAWLPWSRGPDRATDQASATRPAPAPPPSARFYLFAEGSPSGPLALLC